MNVTTFRRILAAGLVLAAATPVAAQQQDTTKLPPGVELATRYTKLGRPLIAVRPFSGLVTMDLALQVADVIRNDLLLSDRFEIATPPSSLDQGPVDYAVWNSLNIVYLVTGDLAEDGLGGSLLDITLHDVVYGNIVQQRAFALPAMTSTDFRLAIHVVSDEIVRWLTRQPGMAATRVAFIRKNGEDAGYDLMVVDADGENLRRLVGSPDILYSPTWSPDGRRLMYMVKTESGSRLAERDMASGRTRTVYTSPTLVFTPTYAPDGTHIAFALDVGTGAEIHSYDLSRECCLVRLTRTRADNLSPTYSPDGSRLAFQSNRTGRQHIYVMDADGSAQTILSPLGTSVEYAAPDWSPTSDEVVFHGQSRGTFQLMLADASRPGAQIQQLTSVGRNEDPSWAPDGRHIVYTGVAAGAVGLYVIDTKTGQIRRLASGTLRLAEWSPSLAGTIGLSQ
jgi:TolB protein